MSDQTRLRLAKSARTTMKDAKLIGPADPDEKMEVTIYLRRGSAGVYPNIAQQASSPVKERRQLSRAFETKLDRYQHPTAGSFRGREGTLTIPSDLAAAVEGVFGLDNRPQAKPHFRIRRKPAGQAQAHDVQAGYNPTLVGQAYDFPTDASEITLDGTGQAIAILELGGGYNVSDLNSYFNNAAPNVTAIGVDGGSNSPTNDPNGPDGEVELDIEVAGSIAPKAQIGVYFAPNTDQGFLDALTSAIHDTNLKPSVISISWGGPENTWTTQAMNAFDSAAQDAATMGVTIFAASGDNGATDGS